MSGSESLASFTNRTFYLSRPPGFRMAFDAAERNGRFGRIQCQRGKESSSRGKRRIFLCRRTVRVKVGGKAIPASFLKIERRGDACWGDRPEREGQIEELVGDQNPSSEAPPSSKKRWSKGDARRGASARGVMEKGGCVRVIEGRRSEEMTQSNTSPPAGVGSTS